LRNMQKLRKGTPVASSLFHGKESEEKQACSVAEERGENIRRKVSDKKKKVRKKMPSLHLC
jgi:hypothetical protein